MKLLFMPYPSTSGTWGCTVYHLAIAREARRRGHEVVFHACPPSSRLLIQNDFDVRPFHGAVGSGETHAVDNIYDVFALLGLDDFGYWQYLMDREQEVIEAVRPDVLIAGMRPTATISARRFGIPLAGLAAVGTDPRLQTPPDGSPLDDLARKAAQPYLDQPLKAFPDLLFWLADKKIATSFEQFEPELGDIPGLPYVGYLNGTNRMGLQTLPPRPERLVVAYLSTVGWNSQTMVQSLARAAELAGVNIWCVTNANGTTVKVDDRLMIFDYLPLDELLPECSGLLFHGGQGTSLASLFHGIPSIACPGQHYERRYNAERIQALGCGLHASVLDLRPRVLSGLLSQVVDESSFSAAASTAQRLLHALPGAAGAVDAIESTRA